MAANPRPRRRLVGVSTKMYFSAARTASFVASTLNLLSSPEPRSQPQTQSRSPPADPNGKSEALSDVDIFIIPDHLTLASVVAQIRAVPTTVPASRILVGAQNCADRDAGPLTGEVSPAVLAELGCAVVELGHAERRALFGETDDKVAKKAEAVMRNGMVPLVCIGEASPPSQNGGDVKAAADEVLEQVRAVLKVVSEGKEVILAYEPVWAIGAAEPADGKYVCEVVRRVRESEEVRGREGSVRIVYGGSAGPGLFKRLKGEVDGLFLGRFAHDPGQFVKTVWEVAEA